MGTPEVGLGLAARSGAAASASGKLETFKYDDRIVRQFALATVVWALIATLVGLVVAILLVWPKLTGGYPWLSFGRLRPVHTNAAIFAFAGNAIFAAVYYSTQRLCKARMWSDWLSRIHMWGWQLVILAGAVTLPLGYTQSKEYAELEWPIDIAIAVVWVVFGINFIMTLVRRRERHLYVALWFYIATIVTVAVLHIFNNLVLPWGILNSYPVYAGVQDALMQWWYGHNAVAFFLTTPFLGLMYYFLPKAADRPIFSYKLSILHFWSLVFIYIWAGPHHLHYTALPEWASTLGMLFSIMLWLPSWGGMINGLLTLRGAWHKVATDPVLKFFVVGITFYGMATFEGPMLSVRSVNALSHYTDWTIAHVHAGTLGWNGMMTFGMLYWLLPRLFQTPLWSSKLATGHFWASTLGILLYIVPVYMAGLAQGLMWRALDETGRLVYPDFVESVEAVVPLWWVRVGGGALYIAGIGMLAFNWAMTWAHRPAKYEEPEYSAPALAASYRDEAPRPSELEGAPVLEMGKRLEAWSRMDWHRRWERLPIRFTVLVTIAVVVASLFEIIPTFLIRSNVPTIGTVRPYTPLELAGRELYISEGCYNCHSQMVRPIVAETKRYGEYSKAGEFVYDRPFQWGSRRIGPDLAREGGRQSHLWHWLHFENPDQIAPGSVMPPFPHLLTDKLKFKEVPKLVETMYQLGAPYTPEERAQAEELARWQGLEIAAEIVQQGGPINTQETQAAALIAYIQRLGIDLFRTEEAPTTEGAPVPALAESSDTPPAAEGAELTRVPLATAAGAP